MQLSMYCVLSARHVSGLHAHHQEQWMLNFFTYTVYGFLAPDDGRVSRKHVELKVHNKYSIALSW